MLSGVCLFVGLTKALPQKVSLIGLDLSGSPEVFGWFLFSITFYFFITSLVLVVLDLIKHYLPYIVIKKGANVTGSVIGLTEEECQSENFEHYLDQPEVGTAHSEFQDIQRQRKYIEVSYNSKYIKLANSTKLLFDILFPLVFAVISISTLAKFLWPTCP